MHKYKFVTWEGNDNGDEYITKEWVIQQYKDDNVYLWNRDLLNYGIYKRGGYCYDFKDTLKKFVYKTDYGIYEGYAPNKTLLRKTLHTRVYYIKDLTKK